MPNILIIDDNIDLCRALSRKLSRDMNYLVECAHTLEDGLSKALMGNYDVVYLDVMMPDGNGLLILPILKNSISSPEVIIITGKGEAEGAALAITNGAWDYVLKGSSLDTLTLPLERALQYRHERLRQEATKALKRDNIIGNSPQINACLDIVARAATTNSNVLIEGETGAGKELFARAIHENSLRSNSNLVVVDCAGIPETLIESMLFGHEKGAFTGAEKARAGLISEADGGTLFLDEVGELSPSIQKSFLRVLQEGTYRPVGSDKELNSDFRIVAATNRNLSTLIQKGVFRQDLLFRLNTITIKLPPLRERHEDIRTIAINHIAKVCERLGLANKGFSPEFMEGLMAYNWPGNVRELIHVLERAITIAGFESTLLPQFLPGHIRLLLVEKMIQASPKTEAAQPDTSESLPHYKKFREAAQHQTERQYLLNLMELVGGDILRASQISGLSRSQLYKMLKKHRVTK